MYSGSPLRSGAFGFCGEPPAKYPASPWRARGRLRGRFRQVAGERSGLARAAYRCVIGWRQHQALRLCRRQNLLEQPAGFIFLIVCHGYSFPALPRLPATLLPTSSQKLGVFAAWVSSPRRLSAAFEEVP